PAAASPWREAAATRPPSRRDDPLSPMTTATATRPTSAVLSPPWLIVSGDFALHGGMDKSNYHLAWYLAEELQRPVTLVAHHVDEPLASHHRVRYVRVPRPLRSHRLGAPLLDWTGRAEANRLRAVAPQGRVLVTRSNGNW